MSRNHWLVYHSQRTVQHPYASLGEHAVYSNRSQTQLCFGDVIWVVEGSTDSPTRYAVVDCFRYSDTGYPPFPAPYSGFKFKAIGPETLIDAPFGLDVTGDWPRQIRDRFFSKQRFFVNLANEPAIVRGLVAETRPRL